MLRRRNRSVPIFCPRIAVPSVAGVPSARPDLHQLQERGKTMKLKLGMMGLLAALLFASAASADTLRVVVVQTTDAAAYVKALQDGAAILKSKGSAGRIRAWMATFAGPETGTVVVSIEYPNMEALTKDMG